MSSARRLCWFVCLAAIAVGCRAQAHPPKDLGQGHWFKPTSEPVISSPAVWDLNGDGVKEIAVGSWDGYFYLLDHRLHDLPGWPKFSPKGFFSSPALGDADGDGYPEVWVGSESGKLFGWHADGRDVAGFPLNLGYRLWASPCVLPCPRIAIGGKGQMYVVDMQGQPVNGWPQPLQGWPDATTAYGFGLLAVTTLTPGDPSRGWLYVWTEEGQLLPGFPLDLGMDADSSPALGDFDGDGRPWIVYGDDAGWLHVVNTAGRERAGTPSRAAGTGFPVRTGGPRPGPTPTPAPPGGNVYSIEASPALGDLNGDGRLEIVVGSWDGRLYVWDDRGEPLPGWPIAVGDQIISSAALVDLDGDDRLDIIVGSKDHHLYGWTADGRSLPGFPFDLGDAVFSSPWVGDLEGDGRADIVVGANNGVHVLVDVGPLGRQGWPMFHHDAARSGALP